MMSSRSRNPIAPRREYLGKYVPAKKGRCSGVMKMLIGQPPLPVKAWQTAIYTLSMSGRSSLSTLTDTKYWFKIPAISGSSKLSWAITWHQWQVL